MSEIESTPKRILLTGGTEGIGRSVIDQFINFDPENNFVLTCSRNKLKNDQLVKEDHGRIIAQTIDLGDKDGVNTLIRDSLETKIDTVILNAAVTGVQEIDREKYTEEYIEAVNKFSQIEIINRLLPLLRKQKSLVIFVSSPMTSSDKVPNESELYVKTKKAVENKIQDLVLKEENKQTSFLIIDPGSVGTRIHKNILNFVDKSSNLYKRTEGLLKSKKLRDPKVIGKIFYHIADSRALFNPETNRYELPIVSGMKYIISDEEYNFNK